MSQLGLFAAPVPPPAPVHVGDEWHAPTGRIWRVTATDREQITMQHTHNGFPRTVTMTEAQWRANGWRPGT